MATFKGYRLGQTVINEIGRYLETGYLKWEIAWEMERVSA